jgi:gamma-glutamyltranspeptidase/glutathione hydrolase
MSFPNSFWPHAYRPGVLAVESRVGDDVLSGLADRGHRIERWPDWEALTGGACAIKVDRGALFAGADPRRESYAIGR